jgi:hypothetical protein
LLNALTLQTAKASMKYVVMDFAKWNAYLDLVVVATNALIILIVFLEKRVAQMEDVQPYVLEGLREWGAVRI